MAIKRPDIYEHNNPNLAIADSDFVNGGFRTAVGAVTDLYALSGKTGYPSAPGQLKEHSTIVYVSGETKYYVLKDITNVANAAGWEEFSGGGTGTLTGATNGIILVDGGTTVSLGGSLANDTTINATGNSLNITELDEFQVKTTGDTTILGIDNTGFLLSTSGGTVSLDDNGGLKYSADYSGNYTGESIPDVNYVTGLTNVYLKTDQTTPQNVTGSQPVFDEGVTLGETPSASQISGHTKGRMYYDADYETVSVDIGTETTLQLGQETVRYVYNNSGSVISNGVVVRDTGVYNGAGVDTVTIGLAIGTGVTQSNVIGITTQVIPNNGFGYITTKGNINGLNTNTGSQYSGMTVGDELYLSPTVFGGITNITPTSPDIVILLGRLLTKDGTDGKIFVEINPALSLNDLINVNTPHPVLDNILKWNGLEWTDAAIGTTSASAGVNFYYSTPIINTVSSPAGISQDGTSGNGIQVSTLSKIPVTTGGTVIVAGLSASDSRAFSAWKSPITIDRTLISSGLWEFYDYVNVSTVVGETYLIHGMYQVVDITGSTITTTGVGANSRIASISSGEFTGQYFNPDTDNINASYLETASGIYQITSSASTNSVVITVPTGYVNETGVSGSSWNKLFTGSTVSIEDTTTTLYQTKVIATTFNVATTDRLGEISFVSASGSYTLSLSYNGTETASFFISPFVTTHNELSGLQGGTGTERFHLTSGQVSVVSATSGTNTGDETKSTIEGKLTGEILTHYHPYSGLTGKPDLTQYQSISGFTGYTATTQPIIDSALTGATNYGGGVTVYSGTTDRNIGFNTIVGSGSTTVQKVNDEIIIYTTGSTGNDVIYDGQSPTAIAVGGIDAGYVLTGKSITCIIQDLFVPELFQTSVGTPSTSISATLTGVREIGCSFIQTITPSYSAGSISPLYDSTSPFTRGGVANAYSYSGPSLTEGFVTDMSCVINPYVVSAGTQTWGVCTRYDEGSCIKGSKGTVNPSYPTVCALNSVSTTGTQSIVGAYPLFATCDDITTPLEKITPLYNMSTQNNILIEFPAETVTDKQKFEIPCAWLGSPTNRPLTGVCLWNGVGGTWEWQGGSAGASLGYWTASSATETIQSNSVGYCQYTFNGVQRGATCIRLVF